MSSFLMSRGDGVWLPRRRRRCESSPGLSVTVDCYGARTSGRSRTPRVSPRVADSSAAGACCVFHGHIPPSKQNRLGKPRRCVRRNPSMSYGPLASAARQRGGHSEPSVAKECLRTQRSLAFVRRHPFATLRERAARLTKHQHRLLLTRSNKIRHRRAAGQQHRSNTSARSLTGQLHCATQRRTA